MSDPRIVAINVDTAAIFRLSISASVSAVSLSGSRQLSSVAFCHTKLNLPLGSLKENATIQKIGRNR